MNPLHYFDSILEDYASPKARRALHSLVLLVASLLTIWFAAGQDWEQAVIALVAAIYTGANRANTPPLDDPSGVDIYQIDDEDSYASDYLDGEETPESTGAGLTPDDDQK